MPTKNYPIGEIVWVSCRGSLKCEGKESKLISVRPNGAGSKVLRYRCTTCNRPFHITL